MKKIIILFLSTVLILTSFSSCASLFDYFGVLENAGTEYSKESEVPTSSNDYTFKMDIESYLQYFVSYFHEPYQRGDDVSENNILYLSLLFCFCNYRASSRTSCATT